MQEHLQANPGIEMLWYDYSCMPQWNGDEDERTENEKEEFAQMLGAIADLYLTARVLIVMDGSYHLV
jgi:hypothetical protein